MKNPDVGSVKDFHLGQLAVWQHLPKKKAHARVLLVHGVSEHSGRHLNTVEFLVAHGYEVVRLDLRGAGQSGGRPQWVHAFSDYVDDVSEVFLWIQRSLPELPLIVLGHSLGGAISIHFASKYSRQLRGLILSAPAFRLGSSIAPWKISIGKVLVKFLPTLRLPNSGDFSALSRDPEVIEAYKNDPHSYHFNTLQQGDVTLKAFEEIPDRCQQIVCPTLIVHGTSDRTILAEGSAVILKHLAAGSKELTYIPLGYHEPHNDICKEEYFRILQTWLERQFSSSQAGVHSDRGAFLGIQRTSSLPSS